MPGFGIWNTNKHPFYFQKKRPTVAQWVRDQLRARRGQAGRPLAQKPRPDRSA